MQAAVRLSSISCTVSARASSFTSTSDPPAVLTRQSSCVAPGVDHFMMLSSGYTCRQRCPEPSKTLSPSMPTCATERAPPTSQA